MTYYSFYIFVLKDHRPSGRTTWPSDFSADQLVELLGSWPSSPISWSDYSALTSTRRSLCRRPVGWAARCSILCRPASQIIRRFIISYGEGSPAKLGTPRRSDSSCKSRHLSWGLPWWSDFTTFRQRCMPCVLSSCSMLFGSGCWSWAARWGPW
jgi:hypothetical protein